ncbi:MAG: zinc ribbon domain-containing protein [Candidatus Hodarchaeota archaeon]
MGLEDNINTILQLTHEINQGLQAFQNPSQITAGVELAVNDVSKQLGFLQEKFRSDFEAVLLETQNSSKSMAEGIETSITDLAMQLTILQEKFKTDLEAVIEEARASTKSIRPETLEAIARLPPVLVNLEESFTAFSHKFETTAEQTKDDLKFIKVSYVEDVVGAIRNLSKETLDKVSSALDTFNQKYEASTALDTLISDKLDNLESNLNALIENQTDQLVTIADLRDRVNAIIQVELAALKDRITIYLESSVNELKTSVSEQLAIQNDTIRNLSNTTQKLTQTIAALPSMINQEINTAVETKIVGEIDSMKKELKKMTAFIIRTQRPAGNCPKCNSSYKDSDKYCPNCGNKL